MKLARHPHRPAVVLAPQRLVEHMLGMVTEVALTMEALGIAADDAAWRDAGALTAALAAALRRLQRVEGRAALAARETRELEHVRERGGYFGPKATELAQKQPERDKQQVRVGRRRVHR